MALIWEHLSSVGQIQAHRCSLRTCLQDDGFGDTINTWPGYSGQPPASYSQGTAFYIDAIQYDNYYLDENTENV